MVTAKEKPAQGNVDELGGPSAAGVARERLRERERLGWDLLSEGGGQRHAGSGLGVESFTRSCSLALGLGLLLRGGGGELSGKNRPETPLVFAVRGRLLSGQPS